MTWKKYFRAVNSTLPASQREVNGSSYTSATKYSNWLPEVYSGPPDRLQRYAVYDQMNFDHEISTALDTISDFGADQDEITKLPFIVEYNNDPTPSEVQVIEKSLGQWIRLNKLNKRVWRIFRSTLVYGDQFFIRDPETYQLYWVDPAKVEKVIVNESDGKKIESYFIKDVDLNVKSLVATNQLNKASQAAFGGNSIVFSPPMTGNMNYVSGGYGATGTLNHKDGGAISVDAEHIVHVSLSDGLCASWPFGLSILEQIYKVYKQKELIEDAILIYRVHRAPERRIFYIDVGNIPPAKAGQYIERVKYEVQQKRIPSRTGGSANIADSTYNPMSILEDYYFAVTSEGRGSKVEVLPGGDNLGCLSLDTKVKLLDGRDLSITDIESEMKDGKTLWTYSCHPITGDIAPGLISWAGKTKSSSEVMKITLDNGEEVICTPDHKFPILGLGFVEAKDLYKGQSMVPVLTDISLVGTSPVFKGRIKWLTKNDKEFVDAFTDDTNITKSNIKRWKIDGYYDRVFESQKIKYDIILFEKFTEIYIANKVKTRVEFANILENNAGFMEYFKNINTEVHSNATLSKFDFARINNLLNCFNTTWEAFKLTHTPIINDDILKTFKSLYNKTVSQEKFVEIVSKECPEYGSRHLIIKALQERGVEDFKTFKEYTNTTNHRILNIELLTEKMDVGTLTIDIDEKYHDYHTYALSAGIFTKNSIDDLRYFNNKMLRGLGVPSSYLPSGPDDGTATMNDGKVGSAFIQEYRFSKVVGRYQSQIIEPFDMEFKLFLKHRGITIDSSLFNLKFTTVQSFSEYRQLELDSARINTFTALMDVPYISKRFVLKTYLKWTEEQMAENEKMWKEERSRLTRTFAPQGAGGGGLGGGGLGGGGLGGSGLGGGGLGGGDFSAPTSGLSDVGITSSGIDNMAPEGTDGTETGGEGSDVSSAEVDNFGS